MLSTSDYVFGWFVFGVLMVLGVYSRRLKMSEFKSTPGPWKWFTSNSHKRLSSVLSGKDGDVLYAYNDNTGFPMIGCNERDMALIAAAPDLLSALDLILSYHDDGNCVLHREDASRARAAIAKALGQ